MSYWYLFAFCGGAYLIGNINFSILVGKFILRDDIRKKGSGNPGASNMLRNFGFKWGILILFLDMLKGAIPAIVGLVVYGDGYSANPMHAVTTQSGQIAMYACGLAAVVGHCFPFWTGFRGGKGMATTVGVFVVANPAIGFGGLLLGMFLVSIFKYPTISSFVFITLAVLWEGIAKNPSITVYALLATFYFLSLFTHRSNIYRLLCGNEKPANLFKRKKAGNK
ncbi:MAG: glycerol-3-phosphate acyltransferase [Christensenellaceae bacterium]|jgi:glycerol-3-phosphate acyltransferase PlsY|nr:glycerol-3-phosphate acyltransferase [Christensenellaceae bacterium]